MRIPTRLARVTWRHAVVATVLVVGLVVVGVRGWRDDLRYRLPTPRPEGLVQLPLGTRVELPAGPSADR